MLYMLSITNLHVLKMQTNLFYRLDSNSELAKFSASIQSFVWIPVILTSDHEQRISGC